MHEEREIETNITETHINEKKVIENETMILNTDSQNENPDNLIRKRDQQSQHHDNITYPSNIWNNEETVGQSLLALSSVTYSYPAAKTVIEQW